MNNELKNKKFIMIGPNVIESEEHTLYMAKEIKNILNKYDIDFYFKTSFDNSVNLIEVSLEISSAVFSAEALEATKIIACFPISIVSTANLCVGSSILFLEEGFFINLSVRFFSFFLKADDKYTN